MRLDQSHICISDNQRRGLFNWHRWHSDLLSHLHKCRLGFGLICIFLICILCSQRVVCPSPSQPHCRPASLLPLPPPIVSSIFCLLRFFRDSFKDSCPKKPSPDGAGHVALAGATRKQLANQHSCAVHLHIWGANLHMMFRRRVNSTFPTRRLCCTPTALITCSDLPPTEDQVITTSLFAYSNFISSKISMSNQFVLELWLKVHLR